MSERTIGMILLLALLSLGVCLAGNEEVLGTWDCEAYVDTTYPFKLILQEENGRLTGSVSGGEGSLPIEETKYEAGVLTFKLDYADVGMIDFSAKVSDGKISGTLENYSFQGQLSCTRPK